MPAGVAALSLALMSLMCEVAREVLVSARVELREGGVAVRRDVRRGCRSTSTSETRGCAQAHAAASIAFWIPAAFVMSPFVWKTATIGGNSPIPNSFSVFWFVS